MSTMSAKSYSSRNMKQFARSLSNMPLGVADSYRYWGADNTIYINNMAGFELRDIDGNLYRDFRLAYGPVILGYRDKRIDGHVIDTISKFGSMCGLSLELDSQVAELIKSICPGVEKVRFANSGTEAVMGAVRTARGYTGRQKVVCMEGAFHGLCDEFMWKVDIENWEPCKGDEPRIIPFGSGLSKSSRDNVIVVPLNDIEKLERVFSEHAHNIAAVLIEPILGNAGSIPAQHQYLQSVRKMCAETGTVLIFDEVKTGFRVSIGGAQDLYGISADLVTYAKAIANGYPIAVFGGSAKIMDAIHFGDGGVVHGGTYTANLVGLAAANATMNTIKNTDALIKVAKAGSRVRQILSDCFSAFDVAHSIIGPDSMFGVHFSADKPNNYRDWKKTNHILYSNFAISLRKRGVLVEPDSREPWFICEAHSNLDYDQLELDIFDSIKEALNA